MNSRTIPSKWMYTDGDRRIQKDDIVKTTRGWMKRYPDGHEELICALSTIGNAAAVISSITNQADGTYSSPESLSFTAVFNEAVTVVTTNGTPSVQVYTEEGDIYDLPYASGTGTTSLVFTGDVTGMADGDLVVVEEIQLNGGTILDAAGVWPDNDFPSAYVQPDIAMSTAIISAVANYADGTYDDTEVLEFTVTFDKAVTVVTTGGTPSLQVYTVAETLVDVPYASGTGTTALVFSGAPTGIADGTLVVSEALALNSGTINDAAGNPSDLNFSADYVQPEIEMLTV